MQNPTLYLLYFDAVSWDAGSVLAEAPHKLQIALSEREALVRLKHAINQAKAAVEKELKMTLVSRKTIRFECGYSYFGLVLELPTAIRSIDEALNWLREVDKAEEYEQLKLIAGSGEDVHPPDGKRTSIAQQTCLDHLLRVLR